MRTEGPGARITVSLVVPTMDKLSYMSQTLPTNASLGFDEIIVIDSSRKERDQVRALCEKHGAMYVFEELDRLAARNRGAELASSDWVCICDDDVIIRSLDFERFRSLAAEGLDYMQGGWGQGADSHYAWIFRKGFFVDTLEGYDPEITGGDDLEITLRSQELGKGRMVYGSGLYETETIGLDIARDYPGRWIRNKVLYALTYYPLMRKHPSVALNFIKSDAWRMKSMLKGASPARVAFEGFIERAGLVYSPLYCALRKRRKG
ncbi:MAG: glycosyltransferase family 2 protein [Thermoplasmata archaeon]|nr:glycosyltransferase family 2 protein [Thermoplasmata archaeon]